MTKPPLLIAVVDDEESVRKALMRLMRSVGLSVETFASGPDFLGYIEARLLDCIVFRSALNKGQTPPHEIVFRIFAPQFFGEGR